MIFQLHDYDSYELNGHDAICQNQIMLYNFIGTMTEYKVRQIKTCVNCRHLEILEEGKIVQNLDDTTYIAFRCLVFNYSGKEVFQFPKADKRVVIEEKIDACPFWEEWVKETDSVEATSGSADSKLSESGEY
jgi:hypothetical protein